MARLQVTTFINIIHTYLHLSLWKPPIKGCVFITDRASLPLREQGGECWSPKEISKHETRNTGSFLCVQRTFVVNGRWKVKLVIVPFKLGVSDGFVIYFSKVNGWIKVTIYLD